MTRMLYSRPADTTGVCKYVCMPSTLVQEKSINNTNTKFSYSILVNAEYNLEGSNLI